MSRDVKYYYRNDLTPLDLTDDVMTIAITEEYNTVASCEIVLSNPDGKYSGTDNTGTHLAYDHDVKVTVGGVLRFFGLIVEKKPNLEEGTVTLLVLDYTEVLRRKLIPCMARNRLNESIYDIITLGYGRLPNGTRDRGYMNPGGASTEVVTTGVLYNSDTQTILDKLTFSQGDTVFDGLKKLADLIDYRFWVAKTIVANMTVLTLYFRPRYEGAIVFNVTRGVNLEQNEIVKSKIEYPDRVVVYGNKDLGIVAVAGATQNDSTQDYEFTNDGIKDLGTAQIKANKLYADLRVEWFEGSVRVAQEDLTINPLVDTLIHVVDPQNDMDNYFWVSKRVLSYGEGGVDFTLDVQRQPYGTGKTQAELKGRVTTLESLLTGTQNQDVEPCFETLSDSVSPNEQIRAYRTTVSITATQQGSGPGSGNRITWNIALDMGGSPLTVPAGFQMYRICRSTSPKPWLLNGIYEEFNQGASVYDDVPIVVMTTYYYRVFACYYRQDGKAEWIWSNVVSVTDV